MKVSWLDPKIINITCNTEENGTTMCIEGNSHDIIGKSLGIGAKNLAVTKLFVSSENLA